ncbi:MAG: recombination-associated protein RdgC [Giesbergeria sp.]|uniref:recombination-associated protein RdgC n=1 Tax=Giesbergeria sp. TaxID=2818473 RepID=UPI00260946E4|nr:recombination-associated protein RdgC [Giesbergeria sp.]MDD2609426.1 recombination-associated protein RdgC [Giesbergeria sp.]
MFKNLIIYRIAGLTADDFQRAEQALNESAFTPCKPTEERSHGWIPPRREENGPLIESVGGQWLLRFKTETKLLPASVIAQKVQEKAAAIEQTTGHKPGKRECRELKEEAKLDLLPQAFTRHGTTLVWIDPKAQFLVVDTASQTKADELTTALVKAIDGLSLRLLDTQTSPATAMANWLSSQYAPADFSIDRECELKGSGEEKSVVKYGRHPLDIEEIRAHIEAGKMPTKLALTWQDRVSFVLTDSLQIKKISLLDVVTQDKSEDGFDADVAIFTGEMAALIPCLIDVLDGERIDKHCPEQGVFLSQ